MASARSGLFPHRWLPKTINMQFLLAAALVSVIPLLLVVLLSYTAYSSVTKSKVMDSTQAMLSVMDWNVSQIINEVESAANIVVGSDAVRGSLQQTLRHSPLAEQMEQHNSAQRVLINMVNNKPYIDKIFVGNDAISFTQGSSWGLREPEPAFAQLDGMMDIVRKAGGAGIWVKPSASPVSPESDDLIYYFRLLKDLNTLDDIGFMGISVRRDVFDHMLEKTAGASLGEVVIVGDGRIIYRKGGSRQKLSDDELADALLPQRLDGGVQSIGGGRYFTSVVSSSLTGWRIVSLLPFDDFIKDNAAIRDRMVRLMVIALVAAVIVAALVASGVTRKLKQLMKAIRNWEHSRGFNSIRFAGDGEIDHIGNEFMRIANENEALNSRLYQSMVKEKEAELMALQSQINPHFLYNTLNTIFWMAKKSKADAIANIAVSLSRFFKLSLNNGEKLTTLGSEIELLQHYMAIQNTRHSNRFQLVLDIAPDMLEMRMLKLLLQPLVENCINHGLELKEGAGTICIVGYEDGEKCYVKVIDDGIGFDQEAQAGGGTGYALKNIDERIKLYYGPEFGLHIDSIPGTGTEATLLLGNNRAAHDGGNDGDDGRSGV